MTYQRDNIITIIFVIFVFLCSGCETDEPNEIHSYKDYLTGTPASSESVDLDSGLYSISLKDCEIYDSINDYTWHYNVLLPKDYSEDKSYSVLYLLHGRLNTPNIWFSTLELEKTIDYYYRNHLLNTIIVMPEALDTYYVDYYKENFRYETFFINSFMPEIEKIFSIDRNYKSRYIGGFSMGGYGALCYTFKYEGMFSFCYSMSTPMEGRNNSPYTPPVINYVNKEMKEYPSVIIDIGKDDGLNEVNLETTLALRLMLIPHEFILRDGGHDSDFWREGLCILFDRLSAFKNKK